MSIFNGSKVFSLFNDTKKYKKMFDILYTKDEFGEVLKRERARSDRNGDIFSIVVFDLKPLGANKRAVRYLLKKIVKRTRSIDEMGWIDTHQVGVLLPHAYEEGAKIFAEAIQSNYDIYIYPNDKPGIVDKNKKLKLDQEKGSKTKLNNQSKSYNSNTSTNKTDSTGIANLLENDINNLNSQLYQPRSITAEYSPKSTLAIQKIFVREMPFWKRFLDILGSSLGLILFSPFFILITIIIKLVSHGPVFFKQKRIGYGGKTFTLWKFRTMKNNADISKHQEYLSELINNASNNNWPEKPMNKLDDDPQIITFGNILRKSCLDELPQLINVLLGDMSLVGPRPPIAYEVEEYLCWHKERLDTVPGMTGLWQVSGKNDLTFKQMVSLDIQYSKHISFWLDIKIMFATPFAIIKQIIDRPKSKHIESKGVEQNV